MEFSILKISLANTSVDKRVGDSGVCDEYRSIIELKGRWRGFSIRI